MEVSNTIDVVFNFLRWHEAAIEHMPPTDMHIVTSGTLRIPAHSNVVAKASPVLESAVYRPRKHWQSEKVIRILGVPCNAVIAFLRFLYSSRSSLSSKEGKEAMEKYGIHLLALSHKYRLGWLKRQCEDELARQLSAECVVDVLQAAKLCDASRLYQSCRRLLYSDFVYVQQSEAWRFVQKNDPRLELEILQFLQDTDQRRKRWWRERANQEMYRQLSDAMECLKHICIEASDKNPPSKNKVPCTKYRTCEGLQLLIRHFASCGKNLPPGGSCPHCKRMRQLFRLHSSICDCLDNCQVPLCKQFKNKMQVEGKDCEVTWSLLVKKVVIARVMCSLAQRKKPEQLRKLLPRYRSTKLIS